MAVGSCFYRTTDSKILLKKGKKERKKETYREGTMRCYYPKEAQAGDPFLMFILAAVW